MKDTKITDERIIAQRRKIASDAYQITTFLLLISVLIQQFILHAKFSQYAVEFFIAIGMGVYTTIRHLSIGVDIWNSNTHNSKKTLINSILISAISTGLLMILAGEKNIITLITFFITMILVSFILHRLFGYITKRKLKQIDKELDNGTDDI